MPKNYLSFNIFASLRKRKGEELIIKAVNLSSILIVIVTIVTVIFNT